MNKYTVISNVSGLVLGENLDRNSPAIRLQEGNPLTGKKHPLDLLPGEETDVSYPIPDKEHTRNLFCRVICTGVAVGVDMAKVPHKTVQTTVSVKQVEVTKFEEMAARVGELPTSLHTAHSIEQPIPRRTRRKCLSQ